MEENKKLLLDVHERPNLGKWIVLSIQHVFAMFGATILVPLLVNEAAGTTVLTIPVTLIMSGIGTLIYILCTKGKSPVYLGSSFAYGITHPEKTIFISDMASKNLSNTHSNSFHSSSKAIK